VPLLSPLRQANPQDERSSTLIGDVLFPLPAHRRSAMGILTWWESRRLLYNVIVGGTGLISLAFVGILSLIPPGGTHLWPGWGPVAVYGVLANVCFTFGPLIEITLQRIWKDRVLPVGPALFRQGLSFSVGLTLLPIFVASVSWIVRTGMVLFLR
jgi:hypothetical protein